MKKLLAFLCIVWLANTAMALEIDTLAKLKTNWAGGGTHTIVQNTDGGSGGVYTLDAHIVCSTALTLTATQAVVIEAADTYNIQIDSVDFTISGVDASNLLTFQGGLSDTVGVFASSAGVTGVFNFCGFDDAAVLEGLIIDDALAGNVTVTCNNCVADGNNQDGFGISDDAIGGGFAATLICNNCTATNHQVAGNSDGFTAHKATQVLVINDCTAINCNQGVSVIGGCDLQIDGLTATGTVEAVKIGGSVVYSVATINRLVATGTTSKGIGIVADGVFSVTNSQMTGTVGMGQGIAMTSATSGQAALSVENCIFYNMAHGGSIGIWNVLSVVTIRNCVFYDVATGTSDTAAVVSTFIYNSIFQSCRHAVIGAVGHGVDDKLYTDSDSDYNFFFDNVLDFWRAGSGDTYAANDLQTDPGMVDPANGDFTITSDSNAYEAGDITNASITDILGVTRTAPADIGAYEESSGSITGGYRSGYRNGRRTIYRARYN